MKLPQSFFVRDTRRVARELLGKKLVRVHRSQVLAGWITEVEAYLGVKDRACHTFGGRRTARTDTMYREGGCAYIYLIYGMHHCLNFVTRPEGVPEAVLIRSIEPCQGIEPMARNRGRSSLSGLKGLTDGPGKLAQALALTRKEDGLSLQSDELFIEEGFDVRPKQIESGPRIGVEYAGKHARWPLRFWIS
ncbi:MAG: DNA-3-methyladenine glycosylase [Oligoflexia bacterium]